MVGLQRAVVASSVAVRAERTVIMILKFKKGHFLMDGQIDTITKWQEKAAKALNNSLCLVLDVTYHCGPCEVVPLHDRELGA